MNGYPPFDPSAVAAAEATLGSNNTNGGAHHPMYSMNHAMMNNAAATSLYGMNAVHPAGANSNNRGGMMGVPTLAHIPPGTAATANNKSNPQASSKNENRSAEV